MVVDGRAFENIRCCAGCCPMCKLGPRMVEVMESRIELTLGFFLGQGVSSLERELDWRGGGAGRNVVSRALLYSAAMARDLARIPLHHPEGIAQARFRGRLVYIREVALPTLRFFRDEYDLDPIRSDALDDAIVVLETAEGWVSDGPVRALDRWYATMDEFHHLPELS